MELGARAVEMGVDVVIALGGDGTVNEIVNGMLQNGPVPDGPAFAVVPGGSTNVFVRALGYSASPVEAAGELLAALREGRSREISLGQASYGDVQRWFTFCFGVGLDARVVDQVERRRRAGRRNSSRLFLSAAATQLSRRTDRGAPSIELETITVQGAPAAADEEDRRVALGLVCNTRPWTYLESRPVLACPQASFETGLDLLALRRLRMSGVLRTGYQMVYSERGPRGSNIVSRHDAQHIRFRRDEPIALQMDGEYLGEHHEVALTHHPRALRVIA